MNRNLKYLLITLLVIIAFGFYQTVKYAGSKAYSYVSNSNISIDSIPDGNYRGSFHLTKYISLAKIKFIIKDGKLDTLTIPHLLTTPFLNYKNEIRDSIIHEKNLQFDAVSGATRTSFYIKAAIHNAVISGNPNSDKDP
mgnify:CR=1 FL=1